MTLLRIICALLVLTAGLPTSGAAEENEAPLADAGLDQSVTEDSVVYLDGGGAVDPDGEIVEYVWSIETPRGRTIEPVDPNAELTRFVAESTGRYRVTLTVTDDDDHSRSDTLFIDVTAASEPPASGGDAADPGDEADSSTPEEPPQFDVGDPDSDAPPQSDGPSLIGDGTTTNQPPFGQIFGPDSVPAGGTGQYSIQASDPDGYVADYWWIPPTALSIQGRELNTYSVGKTYTFDVEPGTSVNLPVVLVDNSGARSSISKTVQVTNNPPTATLVGNTTVVVGSVHEYEAIASDPDGSITSYSWTSSPGVSKVDTGGLLGGSTSGEKSTLLRFTEIPQADATATVGVTVRDEHGGEKTVQKGVTVLVEEKDQIDEPLSNSAPIITDLSGETVPDSEPVFGDVGVSNHHKFSFSAAATDIDSDRLVYHWQFGDEGTARTVETGNSTRSTVEFMFEGDQIRHDGVPITVTVEDETGRTATETKRLNLDAGGAARVDGKDIQIKTNDNGYITGYVTLGASQPDDDRRWIELEFGDGSSETFPIEAGNYDGPRAWFEHSYAYGGTYTIFVWEGDSEGATYGRTDVVVDKRTYTMWEFERMSTIRSTTIAKEKPGDGWSRSDINHVEWTLVETLHQTTPILDDVTMVPGPSWERVGTEVEYHTEYRTKQAMDSPGSDWELSKRAVDRKQVRDGWKSVTVSAKGFAEPDWEYVRAVPRTVHRKQTTESVTRPAGSDWSRHGRTGEYERTGSSYQWVSSTYIADSDWDYVRSDRYVRYWRTKERCVKYGNFGGYRHCIDEETTRTPVYGYRYLYKVPEYDAVYEWERTVERTVYDHKYRYPTYTMEPVHEYRKSVQVAEKKATWKKDVYESTNVYEWSKSTTEWKKDTSLSRPTGYDVRNVTKTTKECGDSWNLGEPAICASEDR